LNLQQLVWLNVVRIDGQKEAHTLAGVCSIVAAGGC